jgi:hypothetical protein
LDGGAGEEEDGAEEYDDYSENDLEIVLEQSGTVDSAGAASGGTESPAKKAKITLTEEEENFAKKFRPAASKIDKERKIPLRHVSGRGSSIKGACSTNVGSSKSDARQHCNTMQHTKHVQRKIEGEWGEWVGGLADWYFYEIALWLHAEIIRRHAFRNRLKCNLFQSNRYGFRNHLKCHLLQSIILSLSLIAVNFIDYHFHLLQ